MSKLEGFRAFVLAFFSQFRALGVEAGRPLGDSPRRGVEAGRNSGIFLAFLLYFSASLENPRPPIVLVFSLYSEFQQQGLHSIRTQGLKSAQERPKFRERGSKMPKFVPADKQSLRVGK